MSKWRLTVKCIETRIVSDSGINCLDLTKNKEYDVLAETEHPPAYEVVGDGYKRMFAPKSLFLEAK